MSLHLVPNEVVGYRFRADWYSINVVVVKRHGETSKRAGQEYEEVLAYCTNVKTAATWMFHHCQRAHGAEAQKLAEEQSGSLADMKALEGSVDKALAYVAQAAADLQARIDALGVSHKELVKTLERPQADSAADAVAVQ
jgi:hypothetical protein